VESVWNPPLSVTSAPPIKVIFMEAGIHMEWVDLELRRSDEYWEGQAAVVADRCPKKLRAGFILIPIGMASAVGCSITPGGLLTVRRTPGRIERGDSGDCCEGCGIVGYLPPGSLPWFGVGFPIAGLAPGSLDFEIMEEKEVASRGIEYESENNSSSGSDESDRNRNAETLLSCPFGTVKEAFNWRPGSISQDDVKTPADVFKVRSNDPLLRCDVSAITIWKKIIPSPRTSLNPVIFNNLAVSPSRSCSGTAAFTLNCTSSAMSTGIRLSSLTRNGWEQGFILFED